MRRASMVGALWGIGHTATILLVGGAIVLFHVVIPPRLGLGMEFAVAIMLIVLGIISLSGRAVASADSAARPLVVGLVHGMAGSALVAPLVGWAIPRPWAGGGLLVVFGPGTNARE